MTTGLDYSAGQISGKAIRDAGYSFVIRYVDDPARGLRPKHIRAAEYQDLVRADVTVWLVFEIGTDDALGGYNAGVANAQRALTGARAIGYPDNQPIFLASDMHLTSQQVTAALAYLDGAASVLGIGRTGVYGFPELIAASRSHACAWWQCGHDPGSDGAANIWQRNDGTTTVGGIQCDINVVYHDLGGGAAPQSGPDSIPALQEGDVSSAVWKLADWMNRTFPAYADTPIPLDSNPANQRYGPTTVRVMAEFQRRSGITGPDAVGTPVGPRTRAALWSDGYRP